MSIFDDLHREICANPDNDFLRLLYAEELEEQGRCHRADLIRVQYILEQLRRWHPRRPELLRRERQLIDELRSDLRLEADKVPGVSCSELRRGFHSKVYVDEVDDFVRNAAGVVAAAPVQVLSAPDLNPLEPLLRVPQLKQFRRLELFTDLGEWPRELAAYLLCPFLDGITHLDVLAGAIPPAQLLEIPAGSFADRLSCLRLNYCPPGPVTVEALARAVRLPTLRTLELSGSPLTLTDLRALFAPTEPPRLSRLGLSCCRLDDRAVAYLSSLPLLRLLEELDLSGNPITDEGVVALATSAHLANLTHLSLACCRLDWGGVRALADTKLPLRLLDLRWCGLTNRQIGLLQERYRAGLWHS